MNRNMFRLFGFAALLALGLDAGADTVAKIGSAEYGTLKAAVDAAKSGDVIRVLADGLQFNASEIGALDKDITLNLNFKQFSFTKDKLDLSKGHLTIAGFGIVSGMIQTTKPEDQTKVFVRSGFFPKMALLPILKQEGNPDGWIDLNTMLSMTRPAYPVTDYSQDGDPMQERFYVQDGFLPQIDQNGNLVTEGSYSQKHVKPSEIPSYNVIPLPKATISKLTVSAFMEKVNKGEVPLSTSVNVEQILQVAARMAELETPVYTFDAYEDAAMAEAFKDMNGFSPDFVKLFKLAQETENLTYQEYAIAMCMFGDWYADYSVDVEEEISSEDLAQFSPLFVGAYGFAGVELCKNVNELVPGHKHYLAARHMSTQHSFNYSLIIGLANPFYCSTVDMVDVNGRCKQYGKTVTVQLRIQNTNSKNTDQDGNLESILISQCRYTYGKGVIAKVGDQVLTLTEVNGAIAAGQLVNGMTVKILNDIDAGTKISGLNAEMTIDGNGFRIADGAFEAAAGYKVVDNGDQTWSVVVDAKPEVEIEQVDEEVIVEEKTEVVDDKGQTVETDQKTKEEVANAVVNAVEEIVNNEAAAKAKGTGVTEVLTETVSGGHGEEIVQVKPAISSALVEAARKVDTEDLAAGVDIVNEVSKAIQEKTATSQLNIVLESTAVTVAKPVESEEKAVKLTKVVYDVKPEAVVTVKTTDKDGNAKEIVVKTVISNEELGGREISFCLPLPNSFTKTAKITHKSTDPDYPAEEVFLARVQGDAATGRYVNLAFTHFSEVDAEVSDEEVPVKLESDDILGIVKYTVEQKPAGRESAYSVPWLGRDDEGNVADLTIDELISKNGLAAGDELHVWNVDTDSYDMFLWNGTAWEGAIVGDNAPDVTRRIPRGTAFWLKRASGDVADITQIGLVSNKCASVVKKGAATAPVKCLMVNPFPRAIDDLGAKVPGAVAGDQIALVDGTVRYNFNGTRWGVIEKGELIREKGSVKIYAPDTFTPCAIPLPVGQAFWYISKGGAPTIEW